jgi:hypothetical protein
MRDGSNGQQAYTTKPRLSKPLPPTKAPPLPLKSPPPHLKGHESGCVSSAASAPSISALRDAADTGMGSTAPSRRMEYL